MNKIHYCPISQIQRQFGLYVTGAGHELTRPGEPYPHEYHSSDYYFTWQKGRALADWEYQLLYIREGRGAIQFKRGKNIPVCAGTVIILHPGEWHRYRPDPNTTTEARDAPFGEFKRPDHADRGRNGLPIAGLLLQILPRPHRAGPFAVPPRNATHRTIIPPLTLEHLRDSPCERPIFQGFTFLAAVGAHGSIASNFSISFGSRVV